MSSHCPAPFGTARSAESTRLRARTAAAALSALLVGATFIAAPTAVGDEGVASDLFFSEYVEGSSNNKALEIYNGTGADVSLTGYSVVQYFNGSTTPGLTIALSGTLAAGDVFVLAHASSDAAILAQADLTSGSGFFNGDDAIALVGPGGTLDVIGQIGVDPGTEWGTGLTSTADNTIRRAETICSGRTDGSTAFDPADEWVGYANNTFDGLGSHTATCGGGPVEDAAPTVTSIAPADGAVGVHPSAVVTVTFSEPVALASGAISLSCAGSHVAGAVTGGPTTFTFTPSTALPDEASCTAVVTAASVSDLDANDPPDTMAADVTATFAVSGGITPISAVQGSGETSPLNNQIVTIEGIVVGDYEGAQPALRGFYVQSRDADADDDPATSEGLFVFNGNNNSVSLGDEVRVTGTVGEFEGQTQLSSVTGIDVVSSGNAVTPAVVEMPFASLTEPERWEGMLVTFEQELSVTEYFQLGRFGELVLSSGDRLDQPTAVAAPGAAAAAVQAANNLNRIKIDDALQNQNGDPVVFGGGGNPLTADNPIRGGDSVTGLTGVMTYTWAGNSASPNAYRVRPVQDLSDTGLVPGGVVPEFVSENPRPTAPEEVGGRLKVASFNVLNYFLTLNAGGAQCGPVGNEQECRGAESALEFERQRVKLLAALGALDADVIGLMELENTPGVDAAADLASGLNALEGTDVWASVDTGVLGTDVIRVGAIYRTDTVALAGPHTVLDSSVDPRFNDDHHRPTLAQSFTELATGEDLTLVMNHLKSKGSCPSGSGPDADQGDGAGCWNAERTKAAQAILDWIASGGAGNGDQDVIVMGDMNSYAMEDPISTFIDAGYTDLSLGGYSYVFDGQWGYLDYALVSPAMLEQVTGVTEFHINSDEVPVLDYNTNFKSAGQIDSLFAPDMYRTSDHDPIILGIALDVPQPPAPYCEVEYIIHGVWPGGFNTQVWLKNIGTEPIGGWTLDWSFTGNEQITQLWSGDVTQTDSAVSVENLHYNGKLKPGERITFGFLGGFSGALNEPTAFTLNGHACEVK